MGAKVLHQWATLGPFDFVNVVEAPDPATIARVSVALGARGRGRVGLAAGEHERGDGHDGARAFRPHSIAERAAALGGDTQVYVDEKDYTVVSVGIPL